MQISILYSYRLVNFLEILLIVTMIFGSLFLERLWNYRQRLVSATPSPTLLVLFACLCGCLTNFLVKGRSRSSDRIRKVLD